MAIGTLRKRKTSQTQASGTLLFGTDEMDVSVSCKFEKFKKTLDGEFGMDGPSHLGELSW